MNIVQDMFDNHDGESYSGERNIDATWLFYGSGVRASAILRVLFSASAMADRFVARLGIDRDDALDRVFDMVHAAVCQECLEMPFDIDTEFVGEEVLCTYIDGEYNGEDMDALNLKFDQAVERVAYYAARIEDPDLR